VARGLFVSGTDTGVGKTVVSAALFHRFRRHVSLRYWKPIQTGIESSEDDDTATVRQLAGSTPDDVCAEGVRLPHPVSPHLAAEWSGAPIALEGLLDTYRRHGGPARWIVEGAGGVLVPINDHDTMADLIRRLDLPVVIVSRTTLGTINHTLLSVEALRRRSLEVAGIVMVGRPMAGTRQAIERYGAVTIIGEMPTFDILSRDILAAWSPNLDPDAHLLRYLL
jgi:dethiobiotin synthetase